MDRQEEVGMAKQKTPAARRTEMLGALLTAGEMKRLDRQVRKEVSSRAAVTRAALREYLANRGKKVLATNG